MTYFHKVRCRIFYIPAIVFVLNFMLISRGYSQSVKAYSFFEKAIVSMQLDEVRNAKRYARQAINESPEFVLPYFFLAEIYNIENNPEKVYKYLSKAFETDPYHSPKISSFLAHYSFSLGEYADALRFMDFFDNYFKHSYDLDIDINRLRESIHFSYFAINNPVEFKPSPLSRTINTDENEYRPYLSIDETIMVFTRGMPHLRTVPNNRTTSVRFGLGYDCNNNNIYCKSFLQEYLKEDIYIAYKFNDEWNLVSPLSTINTVNNEGAQCISYDGKTIIFTGCNKPENIGECDLYIMFFENNEWTEPRNMTCVNSIYWDSGPTLSVDGKTLYFSSNRPGGIGGKDIWKVKIDEAGRALSNPVNLGEPINTRYDEQAPFIHFSDNTLYFSSNGHPGLGGYDIFYSKKNDGWQLPQNLGYPINTKNDEIGIFVNPSGKKAYYSTISSKTGKHNIYQFEITESLKPDFAGYIAGHVKDFYSEKPLKAEVKLYDIDSDQLAYETISDNTTGYFISPVLSGRNYALNISSDKYIFYSENISTEKFDMDVRSQKADIYLRPFEIGTSVVLDNIFFEFDSYELLPESYTELNKLFEFLKNNPDVKIEIGGHTDNIGSVEYNKMLSENRANSVFDYLVKKGISSQRIEYYGYYFSMPIAGFDTEEERAKNRRTEFMIIDFNY